MDASTAPRTAIEVHIPGKVVSHGEPPSAGIGGRILVGCVVGFTSVCLLGYWYLLIVLSMGFL